MLPGIAGLVGRSGVAVQRPTIMFSTDATPQVWVSNDGFNFLARQAPTGLAGVTNWSTYGRQIVHNGTLFVMGRFTNNEQRFYTSPDGVNWTLRHTVTGAVSPQDPILWLDGTTVLAVCAEGSFSVNGGNDRTRFSADGINWSAGSDVPDADNSATRALARDTILGTTIAFAHTGKSYSSTGGLGPWTSRGSPIANFWMNAAAGNGFIVAVTIAGEIVVTNNGTSYTTPSSAGATGFTDVIWTGKQFIAVGPSGIMRRATNPTLAWSVVNLGGLTNTFTQLVRNGPFLYAVGQQVLLISYDQGDTWNNISGNLAGMTASVYPTKAA